MATVSLTPMQADLDALCAYVASGTRPPPDLLERVRKRAEPIKQHLASLPPTRIAVELIREVRDE